MSKPASRVYCCVDHRGQSASSMNLINYLSKAYIEALKIQLNHIKTMKTCRNNQTDRSPLCQLLADEAERIDNILETSQHLLELLNKQKISSSSKHQKMLINETITESLILKSDDSASLSENTEISVFNEEELLRSPVLMNRQPKPRKNLPATIISDSTIGSQKDELHISEALLARTDEKQTKINSISPMKGDNNQCSISVLNCTANNDVVECTPVQKSYKKIAISKLVNVDTSITQNGKKQRQAKLAFESLQKNPDISICENSPVVKPVLNKYYLLEASDQIQTNVDDVIEDSPQRSLSSAMKSRSKSIQERKPSTHQIAKLLYNDNDSSLKKQCTDKENVPLEKMNTADFSQFSPLFSSTQCDTGALTKKPKNDISLLPHYNENRTAVQQKKDVSPSTSEIKKTEDNIYPSKTQMSASDADETYFHIPNINGKDQHQQNVTKLKTMPSVKRNLLTSYDVPQPKVKKKDDSNHKPGRTKKERAKLVGHDCYECEKYFKCIGLTESQMKLRLQACSRHRTKFALRHNTPAGFWDEGFPDTQSSSIGD